MGLKVPLVVASASPTNLEEVITRLTEIERRTGLERTLAIGELVLTRFFNGDAKVWRSRGRRKDSSIRRLASHANCPFGKSALHEAVGVFVAVRELPSVRTSGHITASHIACVLSLPLEHRKQILERVERERLSVRQLREVVVSQRRAEGERRGRPIEAAQVRAVSALRACVRGANQALSRVASSGPLSARARSEVNHLAEDASRLLLELNNLAASA